MKKVLLYSGGMDSWLIDKLWKPDVKIFIDNDIPYNKIEKSKLPDDVKIIKFDMKDYELEENTHTIPLRNLIFICIASYYGNEICLGTVKGDEHYDNSMEFLNQTEVLLNSLYKEFEALGIGKKEIKVVAPYKNYTKEELLKMFIENGGDIEKAYKETFSCYTPVNGEECGKCKPCIRKKEAFKANNYLGD